MRQVKVVAPGEALLFVKMRSRSGFYAGHLPGELPGGLSPLTGG